LNCRECPYGKEDFERRMYWYQKTVNEQGISNDSYHCLKPEDAAAEFEQFVWCDKVGGKVYSFGHCTDFHEDTDNIHINRSKRKRRNKRERDLKYKNHLRNLCGSTTCTHSSIEFTSEIYIRNHGYIKNPKPYYKKIYYGENCKRYYKKYANKVVRRYKGEIHNGCSYKKVFDYAWTID